MFDKGRIKLVASEVGSTYCTLPGLVRSGKSDARNLMWKV